MAHVSFDSWWAFCQDPSRDGHQIDNSPGENFATHWGFIYPTFCDARRWCGYSSATKDQFFQLTQGEAEVLAYRWFWQRLCADQIPAGADVCLVDWAFGSGGAVHEIQTMLGFRPTDGLVGKNTIARIVALTAPVFIEKCLDWRLEYYSDLGLDKEYPGLVARANECFRLGNELLVGAGS